MVYSVFIRLAVYQLSIPAIGAKLFRLSYVKALFESLLTNRNVTDVADPCIIPHCELTPAMKRLYYYMREMR